MADKDDKKREKQVKEAGQARDGKNIAILALALALLASLICLVLVLYQAKGLVEGMAAKEEALAQAEAKLDQAQEGKSQVQAKGKKVRLEEKKEGPQLRLEEGEGRNPNQLTNHIKLYLRDKGSSFDQLGLAYYNFEDGDRACFNENAPFLAASTSKVSVVMYLFDLAQEGYVDLDEDLIYQERHKAGGTGKLKEGKVGSSYSFYNLAKLTITHSDNVATNMLYEYLGRVNQEYVLDSVFRVYGLGSKEGNMMTARDGIDLMVRLYNNDEANPYYEDLLSFMEKTIYNKYFTKYIDSDRIAHKTGDYQGYFNDIGIVYGQGGDYAFACYTEGMEDPEACIQDLGRLVDAWHRGDLD